ncbi:hypothetical protein [uncultured Chryseobacterium sp.]|uniref:hypothetical protein n=1 Tax=uncultured Chryseobacterium sp. TaxID=259322 RepID=UPI00258D5E4E|nr:hypothetical protein [uncultured Chryseobacterium sp.]
MQGTKSGANAEDLAEEAHIEEVIVKGKKKGKHSSSNIEGEGLYGGKTLSETDIEDWAKVVKTLKNFWQQKKIKVLLGLLT